MRHDLKTCFFFLLDTMNRLSIFFLLSLLLTIAAPAAPPDAKAHVQMTDQTALAAASFHDTTATAAIEVFRWNVDLHPEAWNAYDSLGEAYMRSGEREQAIQNYEKSLDLNPDNDNARQMLEKLRS